MKKEWYQFSVIDKSTTDIYIYGDIENYKYNENDVTADEFAKELANVNTPNVRVRINSNGGSVSGGLAIYSLLKSSEKHIITLADGFVCSAASVIFMAGKERHATLSSLFLIHNAWTIAAGNSNELQKIAEDLSAITKPSIEIYKSVSKLSEEEIISLMDQEKWFGANEALEYGFVTKVFDDSAKQSLDATYYLKRSIANSKKLEEENILLRKELENSKEKKESGWLEYLGG